MTKHKIFRKFVCTALAGVGVFASLATFSACTTSHPEVEMKISFNDTTYTLKYKLYRKIAPSTVQHFLELAEQEYYNGLCVHNYAASSKLETGGYTYDATKTDEGGLVEKPYFETLKGIEAEKNMKFTQTVWDDDEKKDPVYTVYGEFATNGFKVENGALKQTFGSLTMYYTAKKNCKDYVYAQRSSANRCDWKLYRYNSATSLFYISLSNSSVTNSDYCTFATLEDGSVDTLKELAQAITDFIDDEYEGDSSEFAPSEKVYVDEYDRYVSSDKESVNYSVPKEPIVIEEIKVTKY